MPRQISYRWRLRELMTARGMFTVAELMPHLTERGITLSSSQVHRLVSGTPERLSLPVLATLCDILDLASTSDPEHVRLTTDDVLRDDTHVLLRLGEPPSPVPEPVASLLLDYITALPGRTAAVNAESRRLFPGRRANQPMHPGTLRDGLRGLGVPLQRARTSSIRHLVLQAPAPVIAKALGYHDKTTTRLVTEAGGHLGPLRPWRPHTVTPDPSRRARGAPQSVGLHIIPARRPCRAGPELSTARWRGSSIRRMPHHRRALRVACFRPLPKTAHQR
ncbi:helix-turn-helix domain-containing protein [Streptomyces sp. NPDC088246]|uniref:helix-turn-helix domain-containing protein n=1 Tax=Streptomyces sp. NPDC088246 TaxID=3365842 RepID=UPI0037FBFB0F